MQFVYCPGEEWKACEAGLTCVVCSRPLVEPLAHEPCRQMACGACVGGKCPYCELPFVAPDWTAKMIARPILNKLGSLLVVCPSCTAPVKRQDLDAHVAYCGTR